MELNEILSVSGKPGLYKLVSTNKSNIIAQALGTQKKLAINASAKISALSDISIYTYADDIPLAEVFSMIYRKEKGGAAINHKLSAAELRAYMESVLPDYDEERVYDSDLRKLFNWYNILNENKLVDAGQEDKGDSIEDAEIIEESPNE